MTTLGIIGGIGPESTIEYYRLLISLFRERKPDGSYPSIVINSIDVNRALDLMGAGDLAGMTEYLLVEIDRLAKAGADFGLLAANTPHIVFDDVQRQSPIPLISIVEATGDAAKALGVTTVGLFGTRYTMQGEFYSRVLEKRGIALVVPELEDQDYIHHKYTTELIPGTFLDETRAGLLAIVDRLIERRGIQALILGGTELPLILRDEFYAGIPFLDTTRIHVERAVDHFFSHSGSENAT